MSLLNVGSCSWCVVLLHCVDISFQSLGSRGAFPRLHGEGSEEWRVFPCGPPHRGPSRETAVRQETVGGQEGGNQTALAQGKSLFSLHFAFILKLTQTIKTHIEIPNY